MIFRKRELLLTSFRWLDGIKKFVIEEEDYGKALRVLKEVVRAAPEKTEAHYLMGRVYEYLGDKNAAYKEYEKILEYFPKHPDASESIIKLYKEMN